MCVGESSQQHCVTPPLPPSSQPSPVYETKHSLIDSLLSLF